MPFPLPIVGAAPALGKDAIPRSQTCAFRSRNALATTDNELRLMATLAQMGVITIPKFGYSAPAATGTLAALYRKAKNRFCPMLRRVLRLKARARAIARKSPFTS